ncbi:hypothetical protein M5D96_001872 [Drosophila gunungcola]|uniref:Uncharacterized protein n=1 Tax=Drosophila gunungcola TaxID=103775 RepID=A0A9P9YZR8_9MUSC|nr:hypothetical protein M5D96_001872 [Drosophila gunungcola]
MPSLWLFISMLTLVGCQEYNYQRPQTPFFVETAGRQPQTTSQLSNLSSSRLPITNHSLNSKPKLQLHICHPSSLPRNSSSAIPIRMLRLPPARVQQVLDAGHGSGVAPSQVQVQLLQATGSAQPQTRVGDQVGQSQSSQLDAYDYKQTVPGDTRDYQRFVTSCPGGGQCQQKQLSPGQVDDSHQKVLQTARASTQPRVEGCFKSPVVYVPVGAAVNPQGQLRPKNRRTFERQEQILSRYPYN